jgi:protein SCO1/2
MSVLTSEPSGEGPDGPPAPPRTPPNVRLVAIAVAVAIVVLGSLAFLTMRSESGEPDDNDGWAGTLLGQPLDKPEFTLTDTSGKAYDFRQQTEGSVTLLYFGYTHCPDVCPLHMANLASVLQEVSGEVNAKVKVVFVTTDPARDTPQVIRKWLDNFDVTFVGLTGTQDEIAAAERAAKLPEAVLEPPSANGSYTVGHASQVIAYTLDDEAHVVYPFGIRQTDWARDIPRLVATTEWPS